MYKLLSPIIAAPFLIISIYWVISKYIHILFTIKDEFGASIITGALTCLMIMGIVGVLVNKFDK